MTDKIKRCPFCNGAPWFPQTKSMTGTILYQPECTQCGLKLITQKTMQGAVELWDTRTGDLQESYEKI